jgi:hypothetical protein
MCGNGTVQRVANLLDGYMMIIMMVMMMMMMMMMTTVVMICVDTRKPELF